MTDEIIDSNLGVCTLNLKPNYTISFHKDDHSTLGTLDFNGPDLVFTGNAEESAKVFIDWIAQMFHGRIAKEYAAGRESMRQECLQECSAEATDNGTAQRIAKAIERIK